MNYLITGGAGFIGSTLVNELEKGDNNVFVVDDLSMGKKENLNTSSKIILFEKDIRDLVFLN